MLCQNCGAEMEVEKDFDPATNPGSKGELRDALICWCSSCGREERRVKLRKPVILNEGAPDIGKLHRKCF